MSSLDINDIIDDPAEALRGASVAELADAAQRCSTEIDRLAGFRRPTAAQDRRFDAAVAAFDVATRLHRDADRQQQLTGVRSAAGGSGRTERGDGARIGDRPADGLDRLDRSGVFRAAENAIAGAVRSGLLTSDGAERATGLLERGGRPERTLAARWAAAAGSPDYAAAFAAVVQDPTRGHMLWSPEQQEAYRVAEELRSEMRAMSLTDNSGGYMIPLSLDPAIMLTSSGVASSLRARARVETITADVWNGVTSAGVTSEWLAEATEAAAASATLAQPTVPVYKLSTYVEFSVEVAMDAIAFLAELQRVMLDGARTASETAYAVGTGSGQPTGLVTGLVAATTPIVTSVTANDFTSADVYALQNALGPRWQAGATWHAPLAIINEAATFESAAGARLFPEIGSGQLLRRPLDECSVMDGTYGSGENYVLIYGSLRDAFVIADRIGSTFEIVQHVLGSNRRPTGQRGAWLYQRTGSNVVNAAAAKVLNVT